MANKFVALLLLVCLVTLQDQATAESNAGMPNPEVCYNDCINNSKNVPRIFAEALCVFRCQYANNPTPFTASARKRGPIFGSPASSPIPTPKN
jgi:hypothetical protein